MIKLLNANFYRLKKSITFWVLLLIMGLMAMFLYINYNGVNPSSCAGCTNELGNVFFGYNSFNWLILPIFISIFIGFEYSDGTIKNKIINGHKRSDIYLSNLLTSILVSIAYSVVYIIFVIIIGLILENDITISINKFIFLLFDSFLLNIVISSLFTFICMSISSKSNSGILSLIVVIWTIIITSNVMAKISNATGIIKNIYTFIVNILPYGQATQILNLNDNYNILWLYSIFLIFIINLCGIILIKKKELN